MTDVVVIGAGVSGLATAYYLHQHGHSVEVLERQHLIGGNAVSERRAGFLMEHGPSTMNAHLPIAGEMSAELGLADQQHDLGKGIRNRYLVSSGKLVGIPVGPLGFLTTRYLSPLAKLRILGDILLPHKDDGAEETVMDFCSRRFGREFAERIIDPLVAGLYSGRAAELSVSAVFPKLVALEEKFGSVSMGAMHRRREGGKMPGSRLFSWRDGIGTLPLTLTERLSDCIHTGVTVKRISAHPQGFTIDTGAQGRLTARSVVVATQAHVTAQLVADIDADAAAAAGQIQAPPLAVVFLGYPRENVTHPLDGLGFLTAEAEGRNVLGAQFCSTMFPGRAPDGQVAVSAYIGGARAPDLARLPGADLIELVRAEMRDLIGAEGEPTVAQVRHWPVGLPQYGLGHGKLIETLSTTEQRRAGLYLTGNYFAGPSVANCLAEAQKTAGDVHRHLEQWQGMELRHG